MTGDELRVIIQLAIQIPIVAAFIWYTLRIVKQFSDSQAHRDEQFLTVLKDITLELRELTKQVTLTGGLVLAHDSWERGLLEKSQRIER